MKTTVQNKPLTKITAPVEAQVNFGRALGIMAAEIAKLPKEIFKNKAVND